MRPIRQPHCPSLTKAREFRPVLAAVLLGASACTAQITGPGGSPDPGPNPGGQQPNGGSPVAPQGGGELPMDRDGIMDACASKQGLVDSGRTPLRRLTRREIDGSLQVLLGVAADAEATVTPDEKMGPFFSNAVAPVDELAVTQFSELADRVARAADLQGIAGCDLAGDAACPSAFVERFASRAYRRPVEPSEVTALMAVYEAGRAVGDALEGARTVVSAVLQSPYFLYHDDTWTSSAGAARHPSNTPLAAEPYVLAARLSFFLLGRTPDDELLQAAQQGRLSTAEDVQTQVTRLLTSPDSSQVVADFHRQWLGLTDLSSVDRSAERFPIFGPELVAAADAETHAFTNYVLRRGDGRLQTLLTSSLGFPSGPLFQLYGATEAAARAPDEPVQLDPGQRFGILTQAAFLMKWAHSDQTSPVHRGIVVRENLLCGRISPPPPGIVVAIPPPSEATTTRQRFAQHVESPACAACHRDIDPLGLAFENYDPIGQYRSNDGLSAVDASGSFTSVRDDLAGPFTGPSEMLHKLAAASEVRDCASRQWFRFALGRVESFDDACTIARMQQDFDGSQGNVVELLQTIAQSEAFRHVRSTGESQ